MRRTMHILKILALAWIIGSAVIGCAETPSDNEDTVTQETIPTLTVGTWSKGEIVKLKDDKTDEQWFKFVATASTQRVYVKLNTLTDLYVYLYDNNIDNLGSTSNVSGNTGKVDYTERSLTAGMTYYIKVTGYNSNYTGTYWIGFTEFPAQPETVVTDLIEDKWTNGAIISSDNGGTGEQWFSFIATATTQYLYVKFSTCTDFDVYVYDTSYNLVGTKWNPYAGYGQGAGTIKNNSLSLVPGKTYYIKTDNGTGMYWIGFTEFPAAPETVIARLNADNWANGNIVSQTDGGTGEQWFSFVATDATEYLYVKFSTCTDFDIYVYDTSYNLVGTKWNPYAEYGQGAGTIKKSSWSLTSGKTYYVKANNGTGTYWITFNSAGEEPSSF